MLVHSVSLVLFWGFAVLCVILLVIFAAVRKRSDLLRKSFFGGAIVISVFAVASGVVAVATL